MMRRRITNDDDSLIISSVIIHYGDDGRDAGNGDDTTNSCSVLSQSRDDWHPHTTQRAAPCVDDRSASSCVPPGLPTILKLY